MSNPQRMARWRLVMGHGAEELCGGLSNEDEACDRALSFLYDREYGQGRNVRGAPGGGPQGGLGESNLTVPDWINQIHELFPKKTIERLEKDALERYQLDEMVTNPDVLSRAQPNATLLKAVLRTKHLMNQQVLQAAQHLVRQVVDDLMKKLAVEVRSAFQGSLDRRNRSHLKIAKNFDIDTTLRRNLKHYDVTQQRMLIETPFFYSRIRRQVDKWQLIILVDESGSMMDSVIHSAVMASIFYSMKMMKVHLCIFDTAVVDFTAECVDPVETLMKVQLGGGTDIGQAVHYATQLVENPRRTIVVLITDFFEGAPEQRLFMAARSLIESGDLPRTGGARWRGESDLRSSHRGADGPPRLARRRNDPRRTRQLGRRKGTDVMSLRLILRHDSPPVPSPPSAGERDRVKGLLFGESTCQKTRKRSRSSSKSLLNHSAPSP